MSMHLMGPSLTTTNTKKRKMKFKSAEEKRQHESYLTWKLELKNTLKPEPAKPKRLKMDYSHVRETPYIPSRVETDQAVAERKEYRPYDGERKLLGIGQMHKSNAIPIFDEESAKEIARMRRG